MKRCPRCFSRDLQQGEGIGTPRDENRIFSFDFEIVQCMDCGWAGDERRFDPKPKGLAVVSPWTEKPVTECHGNMRIEP